MKTSHSQKYKHSEKNNIIYNINKDNNTTFKIQNVLEEALQATKPKYPQSITFRHYFKKF